MSGTRGRSSGPPAATGQPGPPVPGPGATPQQRAAALASEWAPVAGRILLALVLAWFGYHELVRPELWTGYVPVVAPTSTAAVVAVLAHGWVLLMLAVALAAAVLLEIIISLTVTAGLSDLTMRDVGVFGLAVCLTGISHQRFALRR